MGSETTSIVHAQSVARAVLEHEQPKLDFKLDQQL